MPVFTRVSQSTPLALTVSLPNMRTAQLLLSISHCQCSAAQTGHLISLRQCSSALWSSHVTKVTTTALAGLAYRLEHYPAYDKTGLCQPVGCLFLLCYSAQQSPHPTDMSHLLWLLPLLVRDTTVRNTAHRHDTHRATMAHPHMDLTSYAELMSQCSSPQQAAANLAKSLRCLNCTIPAVVIGSSPVLCSKPQFHVLHISQPCS
jgi:hypothetical protein